MAGSVATLTHRVIVPCRIAGECNAGPVAVERNNLNFKLGITFFIKRGLGAATEDRHRAQSREHGSTKANCGEEVLIDYGCFVQEHWSSGLRLFGRKIRHLIPICGGEADSFCRYMEKRVLNTVLGEL